MVILIFSGFNPRAVLAFIRTLEKNNISDYGIIANGICDRIFLTKYASKVIYVRKEKRI